MDLNISAEQKQIMQVSPQMMQSLNILMLPQLDLKERIYEEIEKNPALEIAKESKIFENDLKNKPDELNFSKYKNKNNDTGDNLYQFLESRPNAEETLQGHLLNQLAEISLSPKEQNICTLLIQNLNSKGFHQVEPSELLKSVLGESNFEQTELQKALKIVQSFDPIGVCCASLKESLIIQANAKGNVPPFVAELLQSNIELNGKTKINSVLKDFPDHSQKELNEALDFIRQLDPFPARNFCCKQVQYAVPDVYIYELDSDSTIFQCPHSSLTCI